MATITLPSELDELKPLKQWVAFQKVWDDKKKKYSKIPKNALTGYGAKANDPETWADFNTAVNGMNHFNYDGVGFEFAGGYMGVDLDNVIDEKGNCCDVATEIVKALDSYTEYSPSGKGLHILVKTSLDRIGSRNDSIGLEMYNAGRFFTVTGKPYGNSKPIQDRTNQVKAIYNKYLKKEVAPVQQPTTGGTAYTVSESDTKLWQRMFNSGKGEEIQALYSGDLSRHNNDHSRADQALINHLAYWTNGDALRIDAMFRQSGLMRPKWDTKRGVKTYGQKTIESALSNFTPYIAPVRKEVKKQVDTVQPGSIDKHKNNGTESNNSKPDSVKSYLLQAFGADVDRFKSFKDRKTGYSNLDSLTSLYPGLYVIGAISSLGKTTFTHQLGDQLAQAGDHVLYFSLEQSRLEMVTKGISRITARHSKEKAVSAIDIRRGKITQEVKEAVKEYETLAENVSVIECNFNTTIEFITDYVKKYMKDNDVKPVVIVDYLQIIPPTDPHMNTKDAVDGHVRALKKLQSENDLVMMVISSLNRQNYLTPVDFESFKESGGIEYTADVIWGLQLSIMNSDIFDKKDKLKEKREAVKEAKRANPRQIELVCLKNRYGVSSYSCGFNYYPQFDLFVPESDFAPDLANDNPFTRKRI